MIHSLQPHNLLAVRVATREFRRSQSHTFMDGHRVALSLRSLLHNPEHVTFLPVDL